ATWPRIGTASGDSRGPLFFSFALKYRADSLRHSSVAPSWDHSQAGRESAKCDRIRCAVGDVIQSNFTRTLPCGNVPVRHTPYPCLTDVLIMARAANGPDLLAFPAPPNAFLVTRQIRVACGTTAPTRALVTRPHRPYTSTHDKRRRLSSAG